MAAKARLARLELSQRGLSFPPLRVVFVVHLDPREITDHPEMLAVLAGKVPLAAKAMMAGLVDPDQPALLAILALLEPLDAPDLPETRELTSKPEARAHLVLLEIADPLVHPALPETVEQMVGQVRPALVAPLDPQAGTERTAPRDHPALLVPRDRPAQMPTTAPAHAAQRRPRRKEHSTDLLQLDILLLLLCNYSFTSSG